MQSANIFQLRDRYFTHPLRKTTAGVWLASPEYVSIPLSALDKELGAVVLTALQQSDGIVPHPTSWIEVSTSRLLAAGVKSEKAFMTGARLVSIKGTDLIQLEPHVNGGASGPQKGFSPIPDRSTSLSYSASAEDLGAAIRQSFGACGSTL